MRPDLEAMTFGLQTLVHTAKALKCRHNGQDSMARDRGQESDNLSTLVFQVCGKLTGALIRQGAENLVCEDSIRALQQAFKHLSDLKSGASECGTRSWRAHFDMFDQASVSIDLRSLERVEVAQFRCWKTLPGSLPT